MSWGDLFRRTLNVVDWALLARTTIVVLTLAIVLRLLGI